MTGGPPVAAEGVGQRFGDFWPLRGASFTVQPGEIFGIMGPSGAGKTTLLRILGLLDPPAEGGLTLFGTDPYAPGANQLALRRRLAVVHQRPALLRRTVAQNVAFGLELRGMTEEEIEERVGSALAAVGLLDRAQAKRRTLSGGEIQRVCVARALVLEPELLLLDEFTANLDPANVGILEKAIRRFAAHDSHAVVLVTHNLFQARRLATRVAFMLGGAFIEVGPTEELFRHPKDPRTASFVSGEMVY